ncbi:MAG: hypothetical protein HQK76_03105 [Desulfobacterales bacterium]|nr:hypothetical protein [Desulfobacterales bacterium]
MENLLLNEVTYKVEETKLGKWRRYLWSNGELFEEFKSHKKILGMPFLHYTRGRNPETGKRIVAKGFIGIGRMASGFIAIGHAAWGIIAIGQMGLGLLFGLGQLSSGFLSIGQLSIGLFLGIGQFATGYIVVAQLGFGKYVLAQLGIGEYVWSPKRIDTEAVVFFKSWIFKITGIEF